MIKNFIGLVLLLVTPGPLPPSAAADNIQVAVASNFAGAVKVITERFENSSGHHVILAFGSTGKHYAQIKNGAPFDVFIAADTDRPRLLETEGIAVPGSRFTYAVGRLVLYSPRESFVDSQGLVLKGNDVKFLAITNPKLAPYGKAAQDALRALDCWEKYNGRVVQGENVSQTLQYVITGSATVGFVALAQVREPGRPLAGSFWVVPQELYRPIEQQAVLLRDTAAARQFLRYVKSDEARSTIHSYGYGTPSGRGQALK